MKRWAAHSLKRLSELFLTPLNWRKKKWGKHSRELLFWWYSSVELSYLLSTVCMSFKIRGLRGNLLKVYRSMDLFIVSLRSTDCWVLLYCLQCCPHIRDLHLIYCDLTAEKLNHHQCAASTWMMLRLPQENSASALTIHQLQVDRRESHRANQVYALTTHQLQVERRESHSQSSACTHHTPATGGEERVIEPITPATGGEERES